MLTVAEVAMTFGVSRRWSKLLASSATSKLNMDRPLVVTKHYTHLQRKRQQM